MANNNKSKIITLHYFVYIILMYKTVVLVISFFICSWNKCIFFSKLCALSEYSQEYVHLLSFIKRWISLTTVYSGSPNFNHILNKYFDKAASSVEYPDFFNDFFRSFHNWPIKLDTGTCVTDRWSIFSPNEFLESKNWDQWFLRSLQRFLA